MNPSKSSDAGRWALVTGASSGIGAGFARQLAGRGWNVILVARRRDRLEELASTLERQHGIRTLVLARDLSEAGAADDIWIRTRDAGCDVHLLVNNAGLSHSSRVEETDVARVEQLLEVNIVALTGLTYRFLPSMLARKSGGIINVASTLAFQPAAYVGAYAASKAYVLHFSEALWTECRDHGVTVTALCPGTTETELFDAAGMDDWLRRRSSQRPETVVAAALDGHERQRSIVVPGLRNRLAAQMYRLLPRRMLLSLTQRLFTPTGEPRAGSGFLT
ncbi:Fatty acyl-CoA reductase [Maioricimonas rarisocia]|uniref:Fatty acyl-CoA reductase n=1 Tax=Maioricimonas rarisocia TaxID=2528026 RepID=A0A517ZDL7_9PLAN|nr:SDR family oxidoreductase [Maioricimonas rarisocia]QDU40565.1 Fatty acyl-CoA reductase [Maioricimonas rarisocia]